MPGVLNPIRATTPAHVSGGARLVSLTGETLPLRSVTLRSEATGGIARTHLQQHFANPYSQPLELAYSLPLPVDGTVAGYRIHAGDRTIEGRVERREEARASYEAARLGGRTAALLDQERPNLFTQLLGNIPAATDVVVELTVDHLLAWLPGAWEWRFPTVVAPRYLGGEGVVPDHGRVTVDVADRPMAPRASVSLRVTDDLAAAPTSSTHQVLVEGELVTLAEATPLDRDIVIRWTRHRSAPGCAIRTMRPGGADTTANQSAFGLLTIEPPVGETERFSRDLILLLDVSGSMSGKPLEHLKRVVTTLIESLGDDDQLELIAFSSDALRYRPAPVRASAAERQKACTWVGSLSAGGGTEMLGAIEEALRPLRRGVPRQVVVVTDGLIGFESSVVRAIRDGLPNGSRLHAVGVGSAPNRAFLRPASRAGRGTEVLIGLEDAAEQGAARIVAATHAPVLVDMAIAGTALEGRGPILPDLLAGSPVLAALKLKLSGGTVVVRGRTPEGTWEKRLDVGPGSSGAGRETVHAAIPSLWARQAIEDLELDLACGGMRAEIDQQIERIALDHSVSSRLTSWIAIAQEPSVDPRDPVRVERIPQTLTHGMSPEGLFSGWLSHSSPDGPTLLASPMATVAALRTPFELGASDTPDDTFAEALELRRERSVAIQGLGRIVGRPTTTLEIRLSSPLDWRPIEAIRINGRMIKIVERGTTRPGWIEAGMIIRLELAAAPDDIRRLGRLEIEYRDRVLIVTVEPD